MASSFSLLLHHLLLLLLLVLSFRPSIAAFPRSRLTTTFQSQPQLPPTTYFEVTRPLPTNSRPCSRLLLNHSFAYTYSKPPVSAPYSPPQCLLRRLRRRRLPSLAVLSWSASSRGRQFDRIFGVWLSGVELLRSCTAEPRPNGILWTVQKDITKYSSLLFRPQTLSVYLGNLVDSTYTGIYDVNISVQFYFGDSNHKLKKPNSPPGFDSPANLILPVSRNLPLNDGLWFEVQNLTDLQAKEVMIPKNAYRAVLEVYVSYHQNDEFWYSNPPNIYIERNNISGLPGNGAFREVVASLDGDVVGAVWPFTVIYTGGVNPLLWRPITGIGSFDLPTYDIEITPFLGRMLDGKKHRFGFGVTDALDVWYIDANLHLWLDLNSKGNVGELVEYVVPQFKPTLVSNFNGLDGNFDTRASRHISASGWVKSSYGNITTHFFQNFDFKNLMQFKDNGSTQVVNQSIEFNHGIYAKVPSAVFYSEQVFHSFPLYLYTGTSDQVNDSYNLVSDIIFGYNEKKFSGGKFGFGYSFLRNLQDARGTMHVKGNLVTGGVGSTRQLYRFESTNGCYFRNVSSSNYTILNDESGDSCTKSLGYFFPR